MFSVIIPVFNKERTILRAIDSVLDQSFPDFELIIVDDSSTDRSLELIKSRNDLRIRVIGSDRPGPGGYKARNLGTREARNEWITFLDADDQWLPIHLQELDRLRNLPNEGFLSTSWQDSWPDGKLTRSGVSEQNGKKDQYLSVEDFLKVSASYHPPVHTNTVAIRKEILKDIYGFPEDKCVRGGDVVTWVNTILKSKNVLCSTKETAIYHREDSSVTIQTPPELKSNCVYLDIKKKLPSITDLNLRNCLKQFSNFHIRFALLFRFKAGVLKSSDVSYLYFSEARIEYLFFMFVGFLPAAIQKKIHAMAKKIIF